MAKLKDIKKSITELSYAEGMELITQIRFNRRQRPPAKVKKAKGTSTRVRKKKQKVDIQDFVNTMNPEEKAAFIEKLKGVI